MGKLAKDLAYSEFDTGMRYKSVSMKITHGQSKKQTSTVTVPLKVDSSKQGK